MRLFYTDHYVLPLPAGHRFPMEKYARLRERVLSGGVAGGRVNCGARRRRPTRTSSVRTIRTT